MTMLVINVAELKSRLSHYLRLVRRGESVLVRSRDRVIARLDRANDSAVGDDNQRLADLEERGVIRRGKGRLNAKLFAKRPRINADVVAALLADREEGP